MKNEKTGTILLVLTLLLSIIYVFTLNPILQDESYHHFSDQRFMLLTPNFWNVISNLPFLIVGVLGALWWKTSNVRNPIFLVLYLGIIGVSLGSGYYHLFPNSSTLVWDRLPMTITFMALFSIIISEFVSDKLGKRLIIPLILIGLLSISYWVFGSTQDLRFYAWVQFYPMIAISIILIFFDSKFSHSNRYWILLLAYVIAKLLEHFDFSIHHVLGFISGHSLKHIAAAIGLYILFYSYSTRELKE